MIAFFRGLFGLRPALSPEDQFVAEVVAEFARYGFKPKRYDAERYELEFDNAVVALGNVYSAWRLADASMGRKELVERFVRGFREGNARFETFAEVEKLLSPLVRSKAEVAAWEMAATNGKGTRGSAKVPYAPFAGDLVVALGIDLPDSIIWVYERNLEQWGVTFDEALSTALKNFRQRSAVVDFERSTLGSGVFEATRAGDDQSSTLLLPVSEFFRLPELDGDPVVVAPARNHIFLTGSRNDDGLAAIANFLAEILPETPHRCSVEMFGLVQDAWAPWRPEAARAAAAYRNLLRRRDALDYDQQTQMLNDLFQKRGEDVFVGRARLVTGNEGVAFTATALTDGVASGLLPKTDFVVFHPKSRGGTAAGQKGAEPPVTVRWQDVVALLGDALQAEPDLYPPRWRYHGFPDAAALTSLRAVAVKARD